MRTRRRSSGTASVASAGCAPAKGGWAAPPPGWMSPTQLRCDPLVLHLRYFLELGEAELATTLGCARGTVKSRLHRAQARLRTVLAPLFPDLAAAAGPRLDAGT